MCPRAANWVIIHLTSHLEPGHTGGGDRRGDGGGRLLLHWAGRGVALGVGWFLGHLRLIREGKGEIYDVMTCS